MPPFDVLLRRIDEEVRYARVYYRGSILYPTATCELTLVANDAVHVSLRMRVAPSDITMTTCDGTRTGTIFAANKTIVRSSEYLHATQEALSYFGATAAWRTLVIAQPGRAALIAQTTTTADLTGAFARRVLSGLPRLVHPALEVLRARS